MTSVEKTVDAYLETVPVKRQEICQKIRQLCLEHLPGYEESMTYRMPCYLKKGQVAVSWASQKQHISVYFLKHGVMLANAARLEGKNHGKGCLRFSSAKKVDLELIAYLLQETAVSDEVPC
jgi:uncharacterized protein YdhG (YjbR/CyaY superfamily)